MQTTDVRLKIHELIEQANEHQLDSVLEILTPKSNSYTQEEINSFHKRIQLFEENGNKSSSVEDAHANIRSKYIEKYGF